MSDDPQQDQSGAVNVGSPKGGNVIAAGGDVSGVQQVVGENVSGVRQGLSPAQQDEFKELLRRLRAELDAHEGELAEPGMIRGSTDFLENELQSARPNLDAMRGVLAGMVTAASQVASVAEVVTRLQRAVGALL